MTERVQIKDYSIQRGDFTLKKINLSIEDGEIFAILGKTGSGKTMLLESIAGYYQDGTGEILIDGVAVCEIPVEKRNIGFLYQDYGLFPHMTVFKNIAYGLTMAKEKKHIIRERVHEIARAFSIEHTLKQYPMTLSGGEKQRTAMARALIMKPKVLLLDEPFSALDPATKKMLYKQIQAISHEYRCPIIFVTHDFKEAELLASRIGIMDNGSLCAVRTPETLFDPYGNEKIHRFLGMEGDE